MNAAHPIQNSFLSKIFPPIRQLNLHCTKNPQQQLVHSDTTEFHKLLQILPSNLHDKLLTESKKSQLLEVVLDVGRLPEARFSRKMVHLRSNDVTLEEIGCVVDGIGEFGSDNRAGIEGTLHRISCVRSRRGEIVGLTCRVGREIKGGVEMVRDLVSYGESVLFVGRPGVGKTSVMRELCRVLSDEMERRVVVVDGGNEIGGGGDVPHPGIGSSRRLQVPGTSVQYKVMLEAVENHMPNVIVVDEVGTREEVFACGTIAKRGVMLIASAHGDSLESVVRNPILCGLVGGVKSVTLGDREASSRGGRKSIQERRGQAIFPFVVEVRERDYWVTHKTERSVDLLLKGKKPLVAIRKRDKHFNVVIERWKMED